MRYGYWLPVFGGWLRNVQDEGMEASWNYVSRLARRSEEIGYDLTLIAELNLNDIKGAAGGVARCMVNSCGAGSGDAAIGTDGCGASEFSFACVARETSREYRSHQRRKIVAECGVVVVGG